MASSSKRFSSGSPTENQLHAEVGTFFDYYFILARHYFQFSHYVQYSKFSVLLYPLWDQTVFSHHFSGYNIWQIYHKRQLVGHKFGKFIQVPDR